MMFVKVKADLVTLREVKLWHLSCISISEHVKIKSPRKDDQGMYIHIS